MACQICRRSHRRTPETGVYFTQPPRRNPIARVLVPGSGMPKHTKKRTLKAPAHLTQHRAAARRSAPPHDDPLANEAGATPRGRYPPTGGTAWFERPYTSAIGACLVSFVVRRRRQRSVVHALRYAWQPPSRRYRGGAAENNDLAGGIFYIRAGLETLSLVHEHEFVIILRAKSAGFSNLRYTRIESTSPGCSARLACDIDAEEERAT